jgi:O-antigen/teichoic acid export membrane protein
MLGAVLVIAAFDGVILNVLTAGNPEYMDSREVIAPVALGLVIHSLFSQLGVGLNITRNNRFFFYGSITALILNIGLNIFFVPLFGILAAAYASVAAYLIVAAWIYFVNNRYYPIPYSRPALGGIGLAFISSFVLIRFSAAQGHTWSSLAVLLSYGVVAGLIVWSLGVKIG